MTPKYTSYTDQMEQERRNQKEKESLQAKNQLKKDVAIAEKNARFARIVSLISLGISFATLVLSFLFGMGYLP